MACKYNHDCGQDKYRKCLICKRVNQIAYQKRHPDRVNASHRAYKLKHKEKVRNYGRRFEYLHDFGITIEDYDRMFIEQKGYCAICGRHQTILPKRLAVDHDHISKQVRGLLCDPCNRGMGMLKEYNLQKALDYLSKSKVVL